MKIIFEFFLFLGKSAVVEFQVCVDKFVAWKLNKSESNKLEDILVLHLDHGKDFFITISARYIPSCFGRSIEQLMGKKVDKTFTSGPVQKLPVHNVPVENLIDFGDETGAVSTLGAGAAATTGISSTIRYDVPKELHRLIHHITKYGLDKVKMDGLALLFFD